MAEAFLEVLLENLSSMIQKELGLFFGVEKQIERLSSTLSTIRAVLEDAEEKQLSNRAIRDWLQKLKDAAHRLDDILDEISTESLRLEYRGLKHGSVSKSKSSFFSSLHPKHVLFRRSVATKMKDIMERLDEIAQEKIKFHLSEVIVEKNPQIPEWRETTSIITQSQVYGRDVDKEKVIDFLIGESSNSEALSVYTIVGTAGLGKTTLAQHVFNDIKISSHFEPKIWVCVSEDFTLKTLFKSILDNNVVDLNLESLRRRVQEKLQKKRYLLVLDDVWNENLEKWDTFKAVLACGSKGASIVVTTRSKRVANIMGTCPSHKLSTLSDDDCWKLFKERALGMNNEEHAELVPIGKEIVKKCGGLPLAVKTIGGLLRFKSDKKEWLNIKESKLWDLPQFKDSILPALRLSYLNLPLKLRQCFAYCAIFPKDSIIEKEELLHLWMANGFISSSGILMAEDIADQVCHELCWRSFFEDIKRDALGNILRFKMHDLVHDLAQWIMVETCCISEDYRLSDLPKAIHHISFDCCDMPSKLCALSFDQLKSLRTLMITRRHFPPTAPDLKKFYYLRVFHQERLNVVPHSIGSLKHLRYLNLSQGYFKTLPTSICSLWNLQILDLTWCQGLQELPENMKCLKALCHLHMSGCTSLSSTPPEMGQLTCLRTLNIYIVSNKRGYQLAELKHLKLKGELHIKHLEKVTSVKDAKEANLATKQLDQLFLSWGRHDEFKLQENVEQILEALKPHPQLKELKIGGYKGESFSNWMSNPTFKDLRSIELIDCTCCIHLPALGKLPSLKELRIHNMNRVRFIDDESYDGGRTTRGFKSLQDLTIAHLPNLEGLSREEGEDMFPSLAIMRIGQCPKLVLPHLPTVTELVKDENPHVWSSEYRVSSHSLPSVNDLSTKRLFFCSINKLHGLQRLFLKNDEELTLFPDGMLQDLNCLTELQIFYYAKLEALPADLIHLHALQKLKISRCESLVCFPEQVLQGLHSLQTLAIGGCSKLKHLSRGLQYLTSLKNLIIRNCPEVEDLAEALQHVLASLQSLHLGRLPNLESVPDWLENLTSLQSLTVSECEKLVSLPMSIKNLSSLKRLEIWGCPELSKRCEEETGEDWHKIAHVPHVYHRSCSYFSGELGYRCIWINMSGI
ncbi:hypothetical protein L6164_002096 [Bauhinia variegata]|uniref:Uncharacterized protein n=1 Tax=Bauhinia variegata TaxID=167791 RepID=A0ACB9PWM4_BAUVA|nr:hypothetical protein L6164_002096 [Bauhinia variegata]